MYLSKYDGHTSKKQDKVEIISIQMPAGPRVGAQPHCSRHASKEDYEKPCVDAREQGQLLSNCVLTQAETLRSLRFSRPRTGRPGIAKYEKENAACVPNHRGDLNRIWSVSEANKNKQCRQNRNRDNNENSPLLEKYKTGDSRTLGIAMRGRETLD